MFEPSTRVVYRYQVGIAIPVFMGNKIAKAWIIDTSQYGIFFDLQKIKTVDDKLIAKSENKQQTQN